MFQKCGNTINLTAELPLGAAGGFQIACFDPTAPRVGILRMLNYVY